jgi:hypothetical protein
VGNNCSGSKVAPAELKTAYQGRPKRAAVWLRGGRYDSCILFHIPAASRASPCSMGMFKLALG